MKLCHAPHKSLTSMGNKYDKAFSYSCGREHKRKSKELDPQRTLYERVGKESACKQERERAHKG